MLNVYEKIPFGQFDEDQRVIKDIAKRLNRTPGSIAMKLCNFASLDPAVKARGRKGLTGASNLDRELWAKFQAHKDELAPVSEESFRRLFGAKDGEDVEIVKGVGVRATRVISPPTGATETSAQTTVRRGQQFFRQMVLNAYEGKCCVTGIAVRELLVASHILPWKPFPNERLLPQNGLCLSRLHDGAFDRGLITFDETYRLVLSKELKGYLPQAALQTSFVAYEGNALTVPAAFLAPRQEFLAHHREKIFRG